MIPVPMLPDEIISVDEAAHRAHKCTKTIRRYCEQDGIGRQARRGGALQVSAVALEMRINNDDVALELLRENRRNEPLVLFYLNRVGVMP
ncbi:hypothetical protein [Rhizobium sp. HT1-10]|uniref:hypothetical protein n=1 Tax=Rhizobium sp. HT1-10 TaxID=3111638 RepID=UPI003C1AAA9F